ncbi:MAG: hypothetical protein SFX73_07130 [Kofleriaceae bacterium]|nr:hypothetical protein [Kofleriaceae bacterium]
MKLIPAFVLASAAFLTACSWGDGSGTDNPNPTPDAPVSQNVCGDGVCASQEIGFCTQDCGMTNPPDAQTTTCGNAVCDATETYDTCPNDCPNNGGSGSGSGSGDPLACLLTCAIAPDPESCFIGCFGFGGDDSGCTGGAPNGTCDANEMAGLITCVSDCPLF